MLIFPLHQDMSRKIIHIDMDAFFASVEERDHPELKGHPVVIGADPRISGGRGVVSTCNYIARSYGIHSAMTSKEAYERCPQAIFISGNYDHYKEVGLQARAIFKRYTDLVEPMSIDEAYLDVTHNKVGVSSAIKLAQLIQYDIWNELQLTCSAGVSYNKFLAKLASDYQKPRGLTFILPQDVRSFLDDLPIEKFHGVGKKSVEILRAMGVFTGRDLYELSEMVLIDKFGRFGYDLYRKVRGIDDSQVKPNRIRKSIGSERTYAKLLYSDEDIMAELSKHALRVSISLMEQKKEARTIVLKVRYADFTTLTRRHSLLEPTQAVELIERESHKLFLELQDNQTGVRLLGVTATNLEEQHRLIHLDI